MGPISSCCSSERDHEIDVTPRPKFHTHAVFEHYSDDIRQQELENAFQQYLNGEQTSTKFGFDPLVQVSQLQDYIAQGKYSIVCSVHNTLYYIVSNKELVCSVTVID
jgi:hypothetical protein